MTRMFKKLGFLMPVIPNADSWRTWNTSELSCEIRIGDPRSEATDVTARLDCQTAARKAETD